MEITARKTEKAGDTSRPSPRPDTPSLKLPKAGESRPKPPQAGELRPTPPGSAAKPGELSTLEDPQQISSKFCATGSSQGPNISNSLRSRAFRFSFLSSFRFSGDSLIKGSKRIVRARARSCFVSVSRRRRRLL